MIPQEYADFRTDVLENHGIEAPELREIDSGGSSFAQNTQSDGAKALWMLLLNTQLRLLPMLLAFLQIG